MKSITNDEEKLHKNLEHDTYKLENIRYNEVPLSSEKIVDKIVDIKNKNDDEKIENKLEYNEVNTPYMYL